MALFGPVIWACAISFLFQSLALSIPTKTHIIHMNHHLKPTRYATNSEWYADHLQAHTSAELDSLLYTYENAYHGFAAALKPEEADSMRRSEAVLGVYEDPVYNVQTTRTPEFLKLVTGHSPWRNHSWKELNDSMQEVIIGVLDTGIWPESESFSDAGMKDVPQNWHGTCSREIKCNKKLVGAQVFEKGYIKATGSNSSTPLDNDGHGTHTTSIAAGAVVSNASLFGYASGTASGMAPYARIAAYKVCRKKSCMGSDILAGMERAINDGVNILSLSLGFQSVPYNLDLIAIGAFSAMIKGIFVSCAAGNSGPEEKSVHNVAPWIMTVGASTIDRNFPASVTLGNGQKLSGVSLYSGKGMGKKLVELVYNTSNIAAQLCFKRSLDPAIVSGKVVICDRGISRRVQKGLVVKKAGGVGMILANTEANGEEVMADSHLLPAVAVGRKIGDQIKSYLSTNMNVTPTAVLSFGGTELGVKPAPVVAAFSARGPNPVTPEILKPDVIGPGVNILAAWTQAVGPTGLGADTRKSQFNILSGTSMSCPHISGLAALLKAAHPDWSPSAIKSALMTTAYTLDNTNSPLLDAANHSLANPNTYGSGHVDPRRALSPGLVYDASWKDYVTFLCTIGYGQKNIQLITTDLNVPNDICKNKTFDNPAQLNYPSFSVQFGPKQVVRLTRKLTNVMPVSSVYDVSIKAPKGVKVTVKPMRLVFERLRQRQRYTVTFVSSKVSGNKDREDAFGSVTWKDGKHTVRSPVLFSWR